MTRKPRQPSSQRPEVDPCEQRWKHNALDSREPDNKYGTDGKSVWRVSYHDGSLFALVEAATPDEAVEIAKAHREAKSLFGGSPPRSVLDDIYEATTPTDRDLAWARECRLGVLTDMPVKNQRGRPRSRKPPEGTSAGVKAERAARTVSAAA